MYRRYFTDVVKCMQTEMLELKKLIYLYIINYARMYMLCLSLSSYSDPVSMCFSLLASLRSFVR